MIARTVRAARLVAFGVLAGAATGAAASIGAVTIDGDAVPPSLFVAAAERYRAELCPPRSDRRLRDRVVMTRLYIREGERLGLALEGVHETGIENARERLERAPNDRPAHWRRSLEWRLEESLAEGYRAALVGKIEPATVLERYVEAIEAGHPALVDVPLFRYTDYTLPDGAARERVRRRLESGERIEVLRWLEASADFDPYAAEEWRVPSAFASLPAEEMATMDAGDVAYPERDERVIVHVVERKTLSRIRPYQAIDGDDHHARRVAYQLELADRQGRIDARLLGAARVEEDGALVAPGGPYEKCGP